MRSLALILFLAAATTADAADLAGQSRIGALFAEPVAKGRRVVVAKTEKPVEEPIVTYAPEVYVPSIVHGYYGKPNSYYYRSYYGTKPGNIFDLGPISSRAPYGCGLYGYC
ncbi:hypothetical protein RPMA_10920 [Tardiphaga alba]|uniref:Uncharacterized protein n=1 Tax=Tardiphaga alba TaxID=340268 RepID=A0ABX8A7K7_9BRAD|nr:hypothetical protein [Tardiphaga alba]QUS39291.1 hypothetical protein RPMA_10920 [Tardiphaga alba]